METPSPTIAAPVASSLQERWSNMQKWLETSAREEVRTAYQQMEVISVETPSDEEVERIRHQYSEGGND